MHSFAVPQWRRVASAPWSGSSRGDAARVAPSDRSRSGSSSRRCSWRARWSSTPSPLCSASRAQERGGLFRAGTGTVALSDVTVSQCTAVSLVQRHQRPFKMFLEQEKTHQTTLTHSVRSSLTSPFSPALVAQVLGHGVGRPGGHAQRAAHLRLPHLPRAHRPGAPLRLHALLPASGPPPGPAGCVSGRVLLSGWCLQGR